METCWRGFQGGACAAPRLSARRLARARRPVCGLSDRGHLRRGLEAILRASGRLSVARAPPEQRVQMRTTSGFSVQQGAVWYPAVHLQCNEIILIGLLDSCHKLPRVVLKYLQILQLNSLSHLFINLFLKKYWKKAEGYGVLCLFFWCWAYAFLLQQDIRRLELFFG